MKTIFGLDSGTVAFTPAARTLVFSNVTGFSPSRVLAITNISRGMLIYVAEKSTSGGTWSSVTRQGGTLTLTYDTTAHGAGDALRVVYEEDSAKDSCLKLSLEDICNADGFNYNATNTRYSGTYPASKTSIIGFSLTNGMGQSYFCKTLHLSASRAAELQLSLQTAPSTANTYGQAWDYRWQVNTGITVALNALWGNGVGGSVYSEFGDSATIVVRAHVAGYRVTSDYNWSSRRTLLWIGDSIANGSGMTNASSLDPAVNFTFQARNWLNDRGYDYRLIQKTWGGAWTNDSEKWRQIGALDTAFPDRCGIVMFNMGANDWSAPATALANLQIFVPWALLKYPNAIIVVCGPTPAENNTTEAGIATIRSNFSAYVAGLANARVKYLNLGTAFDRTAGTTYYSTADTPGSRIHPNSAGCAAIGSVITAFLASLSDIP